MLGFANRPASHVDADEVPRLLTGVHFGRLTRPAKRAHLIGAHALASYLRFHDNLLHVQPELRVATRALTGTAAVTAAQCLGPDDPSEQPVQEGLHTHPSTSTSGFALPLGKLCSSSSL